MTATDPATTLTRRELWQLYAVAVHEYQLTTKLGTWRQAYCVTLSMAVLAWLVTAHASLAACLVIATVGAAVAVLSAHVVRQSHQYYRGARCHFRAIERALGLVGELGLTTTPGMLGDTTKRRLRISTVASVVLYLVAAADVAAGVVALLR